MSATLRRHWFKSNSGVDSVTVGLASTDGQFKSA
jgi:hypothetical protein